MSRKELIKLRDWAERLGDKPSAIYWRFIAGKIPAPVWLDLLSAIPAPVRPHAASIIWWDFFGKRLVPARCDLFDDLIMAYDPRQPAGRKELINALVRCGYPRRLANKRCQEKLWEESA